MSDHEHGNEGFRTHEHGMQTPTPTAHYYNQVARGKIFGRVLFIVIAIIIFIILFLLFKGIRARSNTQSNSLTANAVLTQGNVKYVTLGEKFDLLNNETAFVRDTDASLKILGHAYIPCPNDPKCVQKGIQVNYQLVNNGVAYKHEYGKSVNTDLFPYKVHTVFSDYQTFATFVIYPPGTVISNGTATGTGTTTGGTVVTGQGTVVTGGGGTNTGGGTTPVPPPVATTWKKITIAGRDYSYPSTWTAQKLEPSLCQGVILNKKNGLSEMVGEIIMYEDIACNNDPVRDPANFNPLVRTLRRHGVRVFVTIQKDTIIKAEVDQIIDKL